MGKRGKEVGITIGFLTALTHRQHGTFGGYLVLNAVGRPLEFHCTAPIKPNRAQEILYGATLESYLFGELIGQTLVSKAALTPTFICTDRSPIFALREFVNVPVIQVLKDASSKKKAKEAAEGMNLEDEEKSPEIAFKTQTLQVGCNQISVLSTHAEDEKIIREVYEEIEDHLDLTEPFMRIREAIKEAHLGTRPPVKESA